MPLEIRLVADPDEDDGSGRAVEVRLTARRRADEDPLEDSRSFAAGDLEEVLSFVRRLLEQGREALPSPALSACRRCDRVFDPAAECERRRPFVCRRCRETANAGGPPFPGPEDAPGPGLRVVFLGTGDAYGSGGRRPAAVFVRARDRGRGLLLDAGPGCHAALRREGLSGADLAAVLVSHFHGDHFGGIPFLELEARRREVDEPLSILAPPGARERIAELRRCLYPSLAGAADSRIVEVLPGETAPLPASVGPGLAAAFAASHQPERWAVGWRLRLGGRTIVYSGDTEWDERMVGQSEGADLLLHECSGMGPVPGHTDHGELSRAADRLRARRTLLLHCGEEVLAAPETVFERAHDGLRITV